MAEIAREAGALLMEYFHQHVKVEYKGEVDLVTVADRKSEALILQRIQARWPQHDVLGEEGARIETGSDYRWYVDPLDGTTNFAHGFPVFCVSLALEWKNQRIAGVIYVIRIQTSFSITRSRCGHMGCGERVRPRWTWRRWPADVSMDTGSST